MNLGDCNINCTRLSFVVTDLYADSVARISALCLIADVAYLIVDDDFNCRCRCRLRNLFVEFSADLRLSSVDVV